MIFVTYAIPTTALNDPSWLTSLTPLSNSARFPAFEAQPWSWAHIYKEFHLKKVTINKENELRIRVKILVRYRWNLFGVGLFLLIAFHYVKQIHTCPTHSALSIKDALLVYIGLLASSTPPKNDTWLNNLNLSCLVREPNTVFSF